MLRLDFLKGLLAAAVINPLHIKEKELFQKIYIHQFFIAGFRHYEGMKLLEKMQVGDVLSLVREPKNKYDEYAIALFWKDKKLGYIPAEHNMILATMLDAQDLQFIGEITHLETETKPWEHIAVAVSYLKKIADDKKQDIPEKLTKIKTPDYKTKKSKPAAILNPLEPKTNVLKPYYSEIGDSTDFYEADAAVLCIDDFPKHLKDQKKQCFQYYPIIKDTAGNKYFLIENHGIYDFMYEIMYSQYITSDKGEVYVRGIFQNRKTLLPIDNRKIKTPATDD